MRSSLYVLMVTSVFASTSVHAIAIKQLIVDSDIAVVTHEEADQLKIGNLLLASHEGKHCQMEIRSVEQLTATVSLGKCSFKNELRIGQELEVALFKAEPKVEEVAKVGPAKAPRSAFDISTAPNEGKSRLFLGYNTYESNTVTKVGSAILASSSSKTGMVGIQYAYGISDLLSLGFSETVLISEETTTKYGSASTRNGQKDNINSDGWGDPTIYLGYRVVDSKAEPFYNLDVNFGYLTKTHDAKSGTVNSKGVYGRGGTGFTLEMILSTQKAVANFGVYGKLQKYNTRVTKGSTSDSETKGGDQTILGVTGQYEPNERFALRGNFEIVSIQGATVSSGTSDIDIDSYSASLATISLHHALGSPQLIGALGYTLTSAYSAGAKAGTTKLLSEADSIGALRLGLDANF